MNKFIDDINEKIMLINSKYKDQLHLHIGEQCDICGARYRLLYSIPKEIWLQISPQNKREGYLCPTCADFRARKLGIELYFKAEARND